MFADKYMPLRTGYNNSGVRLSKDKKNISPSPMRGQQLAVKRLRYPIEPVSQKNDRRKRIMTEYDEEPDRRLGRSTAYPNKKTNLFLRDDEISKERPNDHFLSRFEKNNFNAVKSTKNNDEHGPNKMIANKRGKAMRTREDSIEKSPHVNQISLMKLLSGKNDTRKVHNNKYLININDITSKSRSNSRSYSKGQRIDMRSLHKDDLDDFDKNKISLDKRMDRNDRPQDKTDTVVTVKKKRQQPSQTIPANQYDLTEEEYEVFGNRFPSGCDKIKLLGRGGFSLVWLGEHKRSSKLFAIKQIITQNNHQTHIKEIWFGSIFFMLGGLARPQFSKHPGIKNLSKMYSYEINQKDTWIFYEKCGSSLGNCLYDIKGEKYNGEKVYKIYYKPLYYQIINNLRLLKKIIIEIAKVLQLLSETQIVHSDLKTQNILIKHDETDITEVKLIDYGSSFSFSQIHQFSMATPEYMSHQILNYILCENGSEYDEELLQKVKNYKNPWVIDIWSLGCVLLEIINGVPLWMSLPLLVDVRGTPEKKCGLFAVKGRVFQKIINKQVEVIKNLEYIVTQENFSGIKIDNALLKVLKGMLELESEERISPKRVVEILTASL